MKREIPVPTVIPQRGLFEIMEHVEAEEARERAEFDKLSIEERSNRFWEKYDRENAANPVVT